MLKRHFAMLLSGLAIIAALSATPAQAQESRSSALLDINGMIVQTELYLYNRFTDLLDVFRCGVAVGPGIGAEVAITEYLQLGLYANCEIGVDFPHCLPPFWIFDYYEHNTEAFTLHKGTYATVAFGPWRAETAPVDDLGIQKHFRRDKWDIRAQADLLLLHFYLAIRPVEIIDFFTGIFTVDFALDDQKLDQLQVRRPADQLGRGLSNILFGVVEVPLNVVRVTKTEGDVQGLTKGLPLGIWRFFCREVVGVVETVTFPFGWEPIIEPAYVFDSSLLQGNSWHVYKPSFHKRY